MNIGVGPFVDQPRLRVVLGFAGPGGDQVIVEGRAAGGAAIGGAPVQVAHGAVDGQQVLLADGLADLPVVEVAAATDGFFTFGFDVGGAAHGVDQDLLDQPGTGAAGTGGLGVFFHLIDTEQPLFLDRLDDGALAHAVAAADFGAVGHAHGFVLALVADIAECIFTEHQMIADFTDGVVLTDLAEIPAAIGGIAVQAGADQDVVLDHQLLVHAANRVGERDGLGAFAAHEVAGGEQVDAGDFQLGRGHRALVSGKAQLGQVVGADLGLFEQGCHQAIGDAAMAGAFTDRIDTRVVGLHRVVDQDPTVAGDAGLFREFGIGADAGSHHHQVGRDDVAILELHRADAAIAGIVQGLGLLAQAEHQAAAFQFGLQ